MMGMTLAGLAKLKAEARQRHDGLKMLRLIGPDLDPSYNDQISPPQCYTKELMLSGGNRSGKSVLASAMFAAIARDMPLTTWDGRKIDCRPPHQRGQKLVLWVIGIQLNHIGETIHRLLFQPGAYDIIRDLDTGAWRAFRPWDKSDMLRKNDRRPAKPFIPYTEIAEEAYENRGLKQFKRITLKNGTQILAYASTAEVKMGDPVDGIWIDERIANSNYYPEWYMRTTDGDGWILWSAMTDFGIEAMANVCERAELQQQEVECGERDKVEVKRFRFTHTGNPFVLSDKEKTRDFLRQWSEEELMMREEGLETLNNTAIYPFFDKKLHTAIPDKKEDWDDLAHVLHMLKGIPPNDWTHELILDPGTAKPAILLCAIPPKEWRDRDGKLWKLWPDRHGPYFVPYDEIYVPRTPASKLARMVKDKVTARGTQFYRFIIDNQAGRRTPEGFSGSVAQNYRDAFLALGVEPVEHGPAGMFFAGDPDFKARSHVVEGWMQEVFVGKPRLRIVTQNCPHLVWQMTRNQKRVEDNIVRDEPAKRQRDDVRECLEYWASRNPKYVYVDRKVEIPEWYVRQKSVIDQLFSSRDSSDERMSFGPAV